jgi:hypothetical protein
MFVLGFSCFKMRSCYVACTGFQLEILLSAGIIGIYHHIQLELHIWSQSCTHRLWSPERG